jgi:hypothetical protein
MKTLLLKLSELFKKLAPKTKLIIGVVIVVLLLIGVSFISGKIKQARWDAEINRLRVENQTYQQLVTKKGEIITIQEQRIVTLQQAKEAALLNLAELKDLGIKNASTIIHLQTEVERWKVEAQYGSTPIIIHDTVTVDGHSIINDYLKVPQPWAFKDQWLDIEGTVKTTGVTIDSLNSYSDLRIVLGYSRGFLKKSKPSIVFTDKNPYTVVKDMSNVVIVNKPPFYKRPWFNRLEGAALFYGGMRAYQAVTK